MAAQEPPGGGRVGGGSSGLWVTAVLIHQALADGSAWPAVGRLQRRCPRRPWLRRASTRPMQAFPLAVPRRLSN